MRIFNLFFFLLFSICCSCSRKTIESAQEKISCTDSLVFRDSIETFQYDTTYFRALDEIVISHIEYDIKDSVLYPKSITTINQCKKTKAKSATVKKESTISNYQKNSTKKTQLSTNKSTEKNNLSNYFLPLLITSFISVIFVSLILRLYHKGL